MDALAEPGADNPLIVLIYRHLKESGYEKAANVLKKNIPKGKEGVANTSLQDIYDKYKSVLNDEHQSSATGSSNNEKTKKSRLKGHKGAKVDGKPQLKKSTKLQTSAEKRKQKTEDGQTKAKKRKKVSGSSCPVTSSDPPAISAKSDVADSDSDSSLDVEKWKKLVMEMTDADRARIEAFTSEISGTQSNANKNTADRKTTAAQRKRPPAKPKVSQKIPLSKTGESLSQESKQKTETDFKKINKDLSKEPKHLPNNTSPTEDSTGDFTEAQKTEVARANANGYANSALVAQSIKTPKKQRHTETSLPPTTSLEGKETVEQNENSLESAVKTSKKIKSKTLAMENNNTDNISTKVTEDTLTATAVKHMTDITSTKPHKSKTKSSPEDDEAKAPLAHPQSTDTETNGTETSSDLAGITPVKQGKHKSASLPTEELLKPAEALSASHEELPTPPSEGIEKKKKRKKKRKIEEEEVAPEPVPEELPPEMKKKKKKKKKHEKEDQDIPQCQDIAQGPDTQATSLDESLLTVTTAEPLVVKKKKKKKDKERERQKEEVTLAATAPSLLEEEIPKKKKKRKLLGTEALPDLLPAQD